jgi:hypothetical protein
MKRINIATSALIIGAILIPNVAAAQACVGSPMPERSYAVLPSVGAFSYDWNDAVSGIDAGAELRANVGGPFSAAAGYALRMPETGPNSHVVRGEGAAYLPPLPIIPSALQLCLRAGVAASITDDPGSGSNFTNITVPVGLAIGIPFNRGNGLVIVPAIIPQVLYSQLSGDLIGFEQEADQWAPGVELVLGARRGRLLGSLGLVFNDLDQSLGPAPLPNQGLTLNVGVMF